MSFFKKVNNFLCVKLTQGLPPHPLLQGRPLAGRPAGLRRRRLLRDGGQDGGGGNRAQGGEEEEEGGDALKDIRMVNSGIVPNCGKKSAWEEKLFSFQVPRGLWSYGGRIQASWRYFTAEIRNAKNCLFLAGPPWVDS